jgi:glycerol-3-phosphate acyltransferase PlsX
VALKSCEGTAQFILRKLRAAFARSLPMRMLGLLVFPLIKQLRADLDPSMYNGASFLGLQKVLVKSHGGADVKAFTQALVVAREQIIFKIPARIGAEFLNSPISKINK